jgi:hypothetical protein
VSAVVVVSVDGGEALASVGVVAVALASGLVGVGSEAWPGWLASGAVAVGAPVGSAGAAVCALATAASATKAEPAIISRYMFLSWRRISL